VGDPPEFRRYMLAVTPKELEREHVSRKTFGQFATAALRDLGEPLPPDKSFGEYFDRQPPGKPGVLGEVRRDDDVVSMLVGARVEAPRRAEKPQYVVSSTTLMLVRGKALNLAVFSAYESPGDLEWVRAVTARWIEDLQRLNARANPIR
jgi:hypothetical protein